MAAFPPGAPGTLVVPLVAGIVSLPQEVSPWGGYLERC